MVPVLHAGTPHRVSLRGFDEQSQRDTLTVLFLAARSLCFPSILL